MCSEPSGAQLVVPALVVAGTAGENARVTKPIMQDHDRRDPAGDFVPPDKVDFDDVELELLCSAREAGFSFPLVPDVSSA